MVITAQKKFWNRLQITTGNLVIRERIEDMNLTK